MCHDFFHDSFFKIMIFFCLELKFSFLKSCIFFGNRDFLFIFLSWNMKKIDKFYCRFDVKNMLLESTERKKQFLYPFLFNVLRFSKRTVSYRDFLLIIVKKHQKSRDISFQIFNRRYIIPGKRKWYIFLEMSAENPKYRQNIACCAASLFHIPIPFDLRLKTTTFSMFAHKKILLKISTE